jgi:hypothetical protein
MTDAPAPPHESRTQTARAVILVVVVVVVAVLVLRHVGSSTHVGAAPNPSTTTTTTKTGPKPRTTKKVAPLEHPSQLTVQVLNGVQTGSLAGNLSTRVKAFGYQTLAPENTTAVTQTSVIYLAKPGLYREAIRLAARIKLPVSDIQRTIPATAGVPPGTASKCDLIVVIGTSLVTEASTP